MIGRPRTPSGPMQRLIDANAPLWAGEAEVFRAYWGWEGRTRETDLLWLRRQCYKELFDGFVPRLEELTRQFEALDRSRSRSEVLEAAEVVYEELAHYCAFADVYEVVVGHGKTLHVDDLERTGNWPENLALGAARARHREEHGEIGARAQEFTEGGYCTLYAEGMRLAGRGGVDDAIALACSTVYDDEWDHMLHGIAGLDEQALDGEGWALLTELTVEQMSLRIRMRNAQFSYPLPPERLEEIDAGKIEPLAFDYARAGFVTPVP